MSSQIEVAINTKIYYPGHGAGVISNIKDITFDGKLVSYVEFQLVNSTLNISTPANRLDGLKIRYISDEEIFVKNIEMLNENKLSIAPYSNYQILMRYLTSLVCSEEPKDLVTAFRICQGIIKDRVDGKKTIPTNIVRLRKEALEYLIAEFVSITGASFVDTYKDFESRLIVF